MALRLWLMQRFMFFFCTVRMTMCNLITYCTVQSELICFLLTCS
jgi:hypothetical protein